MGQIIKDQKDMNRKVSYEDISSDLENDPNMVYYIDDYSIDTDTIIVGFLDELKIILDGEELNDNEYKLGLALYDLFDNYNTIFVGTDNNKFNKNIILLSLRDMTNLSTKEIRISMKKFRKLYYTIVETMVK